MERAQLIQTLIDKYKFESYLEIGVRDGDVFFMINCAKKVAVDPVYSLNWKGQVKRVIHEASGHILFTGTSDDFFNHVASGLLKVSTFDIVLIDGMHEFDYALRDIENSLKYLSSNGYIIVHDCNPITPEAACSFQDWKARNFTGIWNGDVWKSIYYLSVNRPDLKVVVIDSDHGLGIISRSDRSNSGIENAKKLSFDTVAAMTFEELNTNRNAYLNLKDVSYLKELL